MKNIAKTICMVIGVCGTAQTALSQSSYFCAFSSPFKASFYVVEPAGATFDVQFTGVLALASMLDIQNPGCFPDLVDASFEAFSGPYDFLYANAHAPDGDYHESNYAFAYAYAGLRSYQGNSTCGVWIETEVGRNLKILLNGEKCCASGNSFAYASASCVFELDFASTLVSEYELEDGGPPRRR